MEMEIKNKITEDVGIDTFDSNVYNANEIVFITESENEDKIGPQCQSIVDLNISKSFSLDAKKVYSDENLDLIISKVASAMKAATEAKHKGSKFIEPKEIEDIKKVIANENYTLATKNKIKQELTNFQNQIKSNYSEQLNTYYIKKMEYEDRLDELESTRKQLVMKRLSQMLFPFDKKTRDYDSQINTLKLIISKYDQKIEEIGSIRPMAKEDEIIMFQEKLNSELKNNRLTSI